MDAAGKNVIAEDNYKHTCLSPDVVLASCGGRRATYELFTDAIEGWAVKSPSLATMEFLKCAFNKWYRDPADPNGSIPGAFAIYPEADGMGALIQEWGNPEIDIYHIAPNETPLILSFSPSHIVSDYVMSALRFFADRFCNPPRSEFEKVMRSATAQVFCQATKLDWRINDTVCIATRGCAEVGRIHSPNLNGQLWRRVSAVSSGNQCQTGSIVSGSVTGSAQQAITSNFALSTSAQTVASVTVNAPQGYVRISMTALLLNYDSNQVVHYVSVTLYKGTSSGTQMLLHPLIAVPIAGSAGQPHGVPDAMIIADYSPSSSQQYTVVMSADANSCVEVNPCVLLAEAIKL
jgi:hypothetical protein